MEESTAKPFLQKHRSEIVEKTKNPMALADHLLKDISKESYDNIKSQKTKQDKMREIYGNLNTNKAFECAYEWLMKNEHNLLEELEKNSNMETEAPDKKNPRSQTEEAMGETNEVNKSPEFKDLNTFAKLEDWVSDPQRTPKLISELEQKISKKTMEELKDQLKDKKLKQSLRLSANNVNNIKANRSLKLFYEASEHKEFPVKLTLSTFFEKDQGSLTNPFQLGDDSAKKLRSDMALRDWAKKKCSSGDKEEIRKVLDCISIKNIAGHPEYPFFIAEKVMVYKNPETKESQIIVVTEEKNISKKTRRRALYQMFVCKIQKTLVLGPTESEINLDLSKNPEMIDHCLKFLSEAFIPALAVFKSIQREEKLYSLL